MAGKVRVSSFAVSADGFGAGPAQSREAPLGVGGERLHHWFYPTKTFQTMFGQGEGAEGTDNGFAERSMQGMGAWILGRNMFGPIRGDWPDEAWKGWWGDEPPYHVPVFVLTHHPRPSFEMKGGTVFHFETGGVEAALERARAAAGDKDIRIGGGTETIRQYLQAGLIDELHIAISPVLLGRGEPFWDGLDLPALGYEIARSTAGERATHLEIVRTGQGGAA
ncbi:dihydrofolate reductase family protein [Brevundimonas sp. Root1279]|uniref:dihydrofolate reductase family protein n=1 Tax=Brevundimonas sp. Root1279 TaxID=1736443 RepID=UPI0006FD5BDA|nr:dihydrofolate reductase family protein [Brevundimonas sp. Root1279]KQW82623.1 deaminase [Brevundimonas sp. Root1279]